MADDQVHPESVAAWRGWLAQNHGRGSGVWLVTWRVGSGRPRIGYEESVEQALRFGWVDSQGRSLDAERGMLWFARASAAAAGPAPTRPASSGSPRPG